MATKPTHSTAHFRKAWHAVAPDLRASVRACVARGLETLKTPEPINLCDWADKHFYLSAESSQGQKRWEAYPYQRGILHAMGDDHIEEITLRKSARVGYALALDTPVPTPSGWSTMGQLQAGDQVFDETGAPCTVRYTSPIYTDHNCFEIVFCDGTRVVADQGHRWLVESDQTFEYLTGQLGQGRTGRLKASQSATTSGIVDTGTLYAMQRTARGRTALAITNSQTLQTPVTALPIPPYTLGLWLGDGHLVSPRITQHRSDVQTAEFMRTEGIDVQVRYIDQRYPDNATLFMDIPASGRPVSPWAAIFRALGLHQQKHIPAQYLRASAGQRLALLRGLMDSDGSIGKNGRCEFSNTNQQIASGVYELAISLGMKASWHTKAPRQPHHLVQYRVGFKPTPDCNPFNLPRKSALVQPAAKPGITHRRRIISVTPVASVPVRCIEVDSASSLFLCTRAMIPTHNTKMLLAAIGYFAQHKRRNQCVWQPTDADSDEFCKAEIEPMLRDVRVMQAVLPKLTQKNKGNTLSMKKFLGSLLFMKGGTSSGNYRRMTLQVAILDEFSAFDQKVEKSADPWTLAHKRLEGATYPKLIAGSTPRIKGLDHTERREAAATARMQYHITCPHCQAEHPLIWGEKGDKKLPHGLKADAHDADGTVRHVCPHCHGSIVQADYLRLWRAGIWVSHCGNYRLSNAGAWTDSTSTPLTMPPRHVAFHVWTAYSPQVSWSVIMREYQDAMRSKATGDGAALEGFTNETLGETWEEEVEQANSHELQKRAEPYPLRRVPVGGLDLVAGVDVQDGWWAVAVWAVGRHDEMWLVDWNIIEGNLSVEADWETHLYRYLRSSFMHWHGRPMKISAVAIDTGGHYTHDVYNFCRKHAGEKYFAIKGDSQDGKPISGRSSNMDVNFRGKVIKHGVKLWFVGTDTAKDLIFGRLNLDRPGPGYIHFSHELPLEFYKGITSEVRRTVRTTKGEFHRWAKVTSRNEPLDCLVYAIFASQKLNHHNRTENQWQKVEDALMPDLFASPVVADGQGVAQITADPIPYTKTLASDVHTHTPPPDSLAYLRSGRAAPGQYTSRLS